MVSGLKPLISRESTMRRQDRREVIPCRRDQGIGPSESRGGTDMPISGDLLASTIAGITFIGCAMTSMAAAPGTPPRPRRREVAVNGKRVKTVDVHAHCIVPAAAAVINHPLEAPGLLMHDTSTRIAAMDAQGIDVEVLSINPYWYRAGRDEAAQLIKLQNETLVDFCG